MSITVELQQRAKAIRNRLRRPPNAVQDTGINLSKPWNGKKGLESGSTMLPLPVFVIPRAQVKVIEYHQDPPPPPPVFTAEDILKFVERYTFTSIEMMKSPARDSRIVLSRMVAIYLLQRFSRTNAAAAIGRILHKDHTSILHARRKIAKEFKANSPIANTIRGFESALLTLSGVDNPRSAMAPLAQSVMAGETARGNLPQPKIPPMDSGGGGFVSPPETSPWPTDNGAVYSQTDAEPTNQ